MLAQSSLRSEIGRFAARSAVTVIAAFVIFGALFATFSYVTAGGDKAALMAEIRRAFGTGALTQESRILNNRQIGAFQGNDCQILGMAANSAGTQLERAVSPFGRPLLEGATDAASRPELGNVCGQLHDIFVNGNGENYGHAPYHRYLHGGRALAAAMVPQFGVEGFRNLLLAANQLVLLGVAALCFVRLARPATARPRRRENLALAAFSVLLLVMSGLDHFGMSMSMGPADLSIHLMFAALVAFGPLVMRRQTWLSIIAAGAAFAIYFEFLTGQIPLGVCLILLLPALALGPGDSVREAALRAAFGVLVFVGVCALALGAKYWVTSLVFGDDVWDDILNQLGQRTSLAGFSIAEVIARLFYRTHHIAFGYVTLGVLYTVSGIALLLLCLWRDFGAARADDTGASRWRVWRAIGTGSAALSVLTWYLVFSSHSAIHSWFMIRPLAAVAASGFGYALLMPPRHEARAASMAAASEG